MALHQPQAAMLAHVGVSQRFDHQGPLGQHQHQQERAIWSSQCQSLRRQGMNPLGTGGWMEQSSGPIDYLSLEVSAGEDCCCSGSLSAFETPAYSAELLGLQTPATEPGFSNDCSENRQHFSQADFQEFQFAEASRYDTTPAAHGMMAYDSVLTARLFYPTRHANGMPGPSVPASPHTPEERPAAKRQRSHDAASSIPTVLPVTDSYPPRPRRNKERNRLAARRCREKSKKQIDTLRQQEHELAIQQAELTAQAASLREEVMQLKSEILRHGACDCNFIQKYLAETAEAIA
ncbi:uncharacterized protein B0I36DRAFT_53172 [Microdochium trichocladiopsis]|uniref:BZIP domain-containing protein n=1 Tax=Microdochium trichocladiopsis TaxID=1682393 RepID=A0A9P8XR88_9PEZI|nr:uncharacterized protein B0I36DRAFT_53172 [Microdochium trichocladiopsis]KAH7012687.1 hypothetical protein B0I36DRAFT_53172 [Microdochium trichocladiopsis]